MPTACTLQMRMRGVSTEVHQRLSSAPETDIEWGVAWCTIGEPARLMCNRSRSQFIIYFEISTIGFLYSLLVTALGDLSFVVNTCDIMLVVGQET
jgi:hypothetical protein